VALRLDLASIKPGPRQPDDTEERLHADDGRLSILVQNERISGFIRSHQCAQCNKAVMGEQIPVPVLVLDVLDLLRGESKAKAGQLKNLKVFLGRNGVAAEDIDNAQQQSAAG
jgi:hypothetical protein